MISKNSCRDVVFVESLAVVTLVTNRSKVVVVMAAAFAQPFPDHPDKNQRRMFLLPGWTRQRPWPKLLPRDVPVWPAHAAHVPNAPFSTYTHTHTHTHTHTDGDTMSETHPWNC